MKRFIVGFLLLGLFFSNSIYAGAPSDKRWEEKSFDSSTLIVKFYRAEQMDTVRMIMHYWENECNLSEPLLRFKLLFAIQNGSFSESLYDQNILGYLMKYRMRMERMSDIGAEAWKMRHSSTAAQQPKTFFVNDAFNKLTMNMAIQHVSQFEKGDPQRIISLFYNNEFDRAMHELQDHAYAGTDLQRYSKTYLQKAENRLEEHYAVYSGSWNPAGNLDVLGNHPLVGVTLGLKKNRWMLDIVGELRFSKAQNTYMVNSPTGLEATDKYNGGYMGLEFGRELWQNNRHEIDLLSGVGYEGFDAITGRGSDDNVSLASKNINFGAGYRFYLHPFSTTYVGLQMRYALIDYNSDGGSDLSGNAFTLRLTFGKARNGNKMKILQSFQN